MRIKIQFASPEQILALSCGEITEQKTVHHKTLEPYAGGLHCQKIFGPVEDNSCACAPPNGLHERRHRGKTCETCGVKIEPAEIRRHRWGHIVLPSPVVHPLAVSVLADVLGINPVILTEILEAKLFFGWVPKKKGTHVVYLNGFDEPFRASFKFETHREGGIVDRCSGALYRAVMAINITQTLCEGSNDKVKETLLNLSHHKTELRNLFIVNLPVIPAGFRPVMDVIGKNAKKSMISDPRNAHYVKILWKCRRFTRLKDFLGIKLILEREEGLLQKAVDELYFGGVKLRNKELEGLIHYISGKTGILRKNLLGKRVDFSGRSVITPNPSLALDEVGLPYKMAYELFSPFIMRVLYNQGLGYERADRWHRNNHPRCWRILEQVAPGERLMLNRQPTLHRLGLMSFKVKLHRGKTIQLSPMVCTPFNADFDGDQMAVHLPLYDNTKEEVAELMSPEKNLLSPLNSSLSMAPSHEMIIGAFFMTNLKETEKVHRFRSFEQAMILFEHDSMKVSDKIIVDKQETCIGRLLFESIFKIPVTEAFNKKNLRTYMEEAYELLSITEYVNGLKEFQQLTFKYATQVGFSLSINDFTVASTKEEAYAEASQFTEQQNAQAKEGLITEDERYKSTVQYWKQTFDKQDAQWLNEAADDNPVAVMYKTGSRVSLSQISQLVTAKGLQADASGYINENPVQACLRNGLDTHSFFRSCTGARKAMYDKKNVTPRSGFLARRLVTAARDFYIAEDDCGNYSEGVLIPANQAYGRTLLTGEYVSEKLEDSTMVTVRSPVFCTTQRGLCATCYGIDPSTRKKVKIGTAVGVIAAQSLTEPTTQLTMRCTGGATVFVKFSGQIYSRTMEDLFIMLPGSVIEENGIETKKLLEHKIQVWDKGQWTDASYLQRHKPIVPMRFLKTRFGDSILVQEDHPIFEYSFPSCACGRAGDLIREESQEFIVFGCKCRRIRKILRKDLQQKISLVSELEKDKSFLWITRDTPKAKEKPLFINPYVIGFYLAEGNNYHNVLLCQKEGKIREHVKNILDTSHIEYSENKKGLRIKCKSIYPHWIALFCPGKQLYKRMNFDFMYLPDHQSWDLLSGLLDGNGCIIQSYKNTKQLSYSSSSYALIQQISMLCSKLGIEYNTIVQKRSAKYKHSCNINSSNYVLILRLTRAQGEMLSSSYKVQSIINNIPERLIYTMPIKNAPCRLKENSIVNFPDDWTYDIRTKSESFTAGFVQNHNTFHSSGAVELGKSSLAIRSAKAGQIRLEQGENITEIWVDDIKYLVKNEFCSILVKEGEQVSQGTSLAVYTNTDLRNEDISGALTVLEWYYEMTDAPSTPAVVARCSGVARLQVTQDGEIAILIDEEQQGTVVDTPVFVYDGERVYKGQFLTSGEVNPRKLDSDDLSLKATIFVNRLLQIYKQEGVSPWSIHLEIIFRSLSELVETGCGYGLYRYGTTGERLIKGANDIGRYYPSWLKILCFGYTRTTLTNAVISPSWTADLPSERLLIGQMPLFDSQK